MTRPSKDDLRRRESYHHLAQTLRGLEEDLRHGLAGSARIPAEWHALAQEPAVPAKVPVTIRVDADVARFFRSLGRGHLTRMNAVLRAFMLARLAGVVQGAEAVTYTPSEEEEARALRREILDHAHAELAAPRGRRSRPPRGRKAPRTAGGAAPAA
jgi:uncharacterized protein (DUF4415 family)